MEGGENKNINTEQKKRESLKSPIVDADGKEKAAEIQKKLDNARIKFVEMDCKVDEESSRFRQFFRLEEVDLGILKKDLDEIRKRYKQILEDYLSQMGGNEDSEYLKELEAVKIEEVRDQLRIKNSPRAEWLKNRGEKFVELYNKPEFQQEERENSQILQPIQLTESDIQIKEDPNRGSIINNELIIKKINELTESAKNKTEVIRNIIIELSLNIHDNWEIMKNMPFSEALRDLKPDLRRKLSQIYEGFREIFGSDADAEKEEIKTWVGKMAELVEKRRK